MRAVEANVLNFIGGLDKVFVIPPFQRNYEWRKEECEELFKDICFSLNNNSTHYLGNVVYYIGSRSGASFQEYILVDGQQRITTILLLLIAIRDIYDESELNINERYLINKTDIEKFRIKLKQTSYDAKAFMSIINNKNITDDIKYSNIVMNYELFKELILSSNINPKEIYNAIERLEIATVKLEIFGNDLSSVQTVFEKINSTGRPLTAADLIRNYLLLANNVEEQEKLYSEYWIELENTLGNDNISRFSKDYLIVKTFDDVVNDKIYITFKEYFNGMKISHIDILKEMISYSPYYHWLSSENAPNEKLNRIIKMLNLLKTDDLYPLYMMLFSKLYDSNIEELISIMDLLSDFMLRYRIVSPSGGGGALRTSIHELMQKLIDGTVSISYDGILFELSNSSTPASRFPNDEDFKKQLMTEVNTTYARVLLYKIELKESKNIPVELNKITIEHLMPQTLNAWWEKYLGGEDEARRIYDTYLNCIGNLSPISSGYNSKNSNKSWPEKLKNLKNVQFIITSSIVDEFKEWKENNIKNRNQDIAKRACLVITSPLDRTRQYDSRIVSNDFEPGLYPLSDVITPMDGRTPISISFQEDVVDINRWKDLLPFLCERLLRIDAVLFDRIVNENKIHKSTTRHTISMKDPVITKDSTLLVTPIQIKNSDYYVEGGISSLRARVYAKQLLDFYNLSEYFQIYVR